MQLKKKVALITGVGWESGKAAAIYLAQEGARVAGTCTADELKKKAAVDEIKPRGRHERSAT